MSGTATQGADILMEFTERAMNDQITAYLGQASPSSVTAMICTLPMEATLDASGVGVILVPDVGDQLRLSFRITVGSDTHVFLTNRLPIRNSLPLPGGTPAFVIHLDLEDVLVRLTADDPASPLATCGPDILANLVRPLIQRAADAWSRSMMGPAIGRALLPLTSPVPPPFQLAARVVTDTSGQRALTVFISQTASPILSPTASGRVHIDMSMSQAAVVLRNETFLARICPQLAGLFTPVDPATPINFVLETGMPNPRCINRVQARRIGFDQVLFTELFLEIRPSESRLIFGGSFEFSAGSTHIGGGRFSVPFTVVWNNMTGQLEARPGEPDVTLILDAWIWLLIGAGVVIGAILGALTGGATAAIAVAAGAATSVGIGALVGAVVGGILIGIVTTIVIAVIGVILGEVIRAGLRQATSGFTSSIPLPVLVPIRLLPVSAQFDDFVIIARPLVPTVEITGNLRIGRREVISSTGFGGTFAINNVALSWTGEFQASPTDLHPVVYVWSLDGIPISGDGTLRGIHYGVNGARCSLTSQMGVSIGSRLCAEAREMGGFRAFACRILRAEGQRTEADQPREIIDFAFVDPLRQPVPDPRVFVLNPDAALRIDQEFRAAVVRGMGVDAGKLAQQMPPQK